MDDWILLPFLSENEFGKGSYIMYIFPHGLTKQYIKHDIFHCIQNQSLGQKIVV